ADQVIGVLQKELQMSKDSHVSPFDICHRVKQTREPFPLSEHKTSDVGDLIHLYLWGPYKGGILLYMWTECALTAVYLTNRLPSSVLNDVRFYENVFPFKMNLKPSYDFVPELSKQDLIDQLNFFDSFDIQTSKSPYDKGKATPNDEGSAPNTPNNPRNVNPNDAGLNVPISDVNIKNTDKVQPAVATRKSNSQSKFPAKFNEYMVNSSKKYGLEKVLKYSHLSSGNYCFSTSLNKSAEPSTFYEAVKDRKWVDAMNADIEALNRNNT
ncbi:hypothetical protein Tco_0077648, partial [Tanacetum coccineum]